MKKYLLGLLLCLAGIPVFGVDLTEYPSAIKKGSILLNIGAGYGTMINKGTNTLVPPVIVSADFALPIGGLPFSLGLMAGFSGEYAKSTNVPATNPDGSPALAGSGEFNYYVFGAGGRFSYHFNWGVDKLDTYTTVTLGFLLNSTNYKLEIPGEKSNSASDSEFLFHWGFNIGGRYFFTPHFGLFLDMGYTRLSVVSLGMAFKF
jgi:hypothetical protein